MKEGDIVLVHLFQSDGNFKLRPALILKQRPAYNDFLVCGISTQLHQCIKNLDEVLDENNIIFSATGLRKSSLIRLLFLAVMPTDKIPGAIGKIPDPLHQALLKRLADFLLGE